MRITSNLAAHWLPLAVLLLLAAALRFFRLTAQSLWYDEGVSAFMTTRDLGQIVSASAADIHPPLYYVLLAAWSAVFGNGEFALRGFSAVLGVAGVWLIARLGGALFDHRVALAAAALLAVSPLAIQYSQEVRMYALASVLGSAATLAYFPLLRAPRLTRTVVYALLATALLYTHYYGLLILIGHQLHFAFVAVAGFVRRPTRMPDSGEGTVATNGLVRALAWWLFASGLVALLYLPWLPYALRQTGYYPGLGIPRTPFSLVIDAFNVLALGIATTRFELRAGLLPFLLLAALGTFAAQRWRKRQLPFPSILLTLWLVLPIAAIVVLSQTRPLYEPRFLMLVLPAWLLLVAAGMIAVAGWVASALGGRSRHGWRVPFAVLLILGALLFVPTARSLSAYHFDPTYARDDYRGLATFVEAAEEKGDAVILTAPGQAEVFGYYYHGDAAVVPLPAQRPIDPADTTDRLKAVTAGHHRVWLVRWASVEADPADLIGSWLEAHALRVHQGAFGTVELRLYQFTAAA